MFATIGGQLAAYLARRRKRARARRSFDGAGALVVALDADGRVEIANGTACAALGLRRGRAARPRLVRDRRAPSRARRRRAAFERLLAGDGTVGLPPTPGVNWRWSLSRDADGRPLGALGWGEPAAPVAARSPPAALASSSHASLRAGSPRRRRTARLAGCGSDEPTPAASGSGSLADLVVTVDDDGAKATPPRRSSSTCKAPTDSAACGAAAGVSAADLRAHAGRTRPARRSSAGPRPRRSRARSAATPVDATFSRTDGCEIERWARVEPLLAQVR